MRTSPGSAELPDGYESLLAATMVVQRRYGRVQDVLDLLSEEGDETSGESLYDEHAAERTESAELLRRRVELLRAVLSVPATTGPEGARDLAVAAAHGYVIHTDEHGGLDVSKGDTRILLKRPWGEGFGFVPGSTRFGSVDAITRTRRGERSAAYWHDGWIRCCRDERIQRAIDEALALFG